MRTMRNLVFCDILWVILEWLVRFSVKHAEESGFGDEESVRQHKQSDKAIFRSFRARPDDG